jgi:hypothetical protein
MDYSKSLFIQDHRDTIQNLTTGQIFSTSEYPLSFTYGPANDVRTSQPEYMIYLGDDTITNLWNKVIFLAVLKNGDTILVGETRENIERNLDRDWMKKTNRNVVQPKLLEEIRNYYPNRKAAKENVKIVGTEVKLDEKDETPIHLPANVKNKLLSFLAYFPKNSNQFQEDYINVFTKKPYMDELKTELNKKKNDQQNAGRKKRTKKNRKSRKTKKTNKTNKKKHLRKIQKNKQR